MMHMFLNGPPTKSLKKLKISRFSSSFFSLPSYSLPPLLSLSFYFWITISHSFATNIYIYIYFNSFQFWEYINSQHFFLFFSLILQQKNIVYTTIWVLWIAILKLHIQFLTQETVSYIGKKETSQEERRLKMKWKQWYSFF